QCSLLVFVRVVVPSPSLCMAWHPINRREPVGERNAEILEGNDALQRLCAIARGCVEIGVPRVAPKHFVRPVARQQDLDACLLCLLGHRKDTEPGGYCERLIAMTAESIELISKGLCRDSNRVMARSNTLRSARCSR